MGIVAGVTTFTMSFVAGAVIMMLLRLSRIGLVDQPGSTDGTDDLPPLGLGGLTKFSAVILAPFLVATLVASLTIWLSGSRAMGAIGFGITIFASFAFLVSRLAARKPQIKPLNWQGWVAMVAGTGALTVHLADGPRALDWALSVIGTAILMLWWRLKREVTKSQ
jgi:hypothetical protein